MDANELRIGNRIKLFGDECIVQTVGRWIHTDTTIDEAPIESAEPIPLTEEWLLKFGFDTKTENPDETLNYWKWRT